VTGAKPFHIQVPSIEKIERVQYTIARIDRNGLMLLPIKFDNAKSELGDETEYNNYKDDYRNIFLKWISYVGEDEPINIIQKDIEIFKEEIDYINLGFEQEGTSFISNMLRQDIYRNNLSIDNPMECNPSMFYLFNETVSTYYTGGKWNNFIWYSLEALSVDSRDDREYQVYDCEDELNLLDKVLDKTDYSLYINSQIVYEGNIFVEPILKIMTHPADLINREQRKVINGIYCPLSKSEIIAGLDASLPVKEYLERIFRYIDTRPLHVEQEAVARHIVTELGEKGYLSQLPTNRFTRDEISIIIQFITKTFPDLLDEIKTHQKKSETYQIQLTEKMNQWKSQIPVFIKELNDEHLVRYYDIIERICNLPIPVLHENPGLYKTIITDFGTLAGNIIQSIISQKNKIDVTISRLADNQDILQILNKLTPQDIHLVKNYSRTQGCFFNKIRHPDKESNFNEFRTFITETNKVLEIFVKNKNCFT